MSLKQSARVMESAVRALETRPVRNAVDWGCIERLAAYAADRRAEMGPEKWNQLQKEWTDV